MAASSKMPQIYVGLLLLVGIGGALWMQHKSDKAMTNVAFTQGSKNSAPAIKVVPEEVDKLVIKAKDKPEIVLEKKDGNWTMTSPTPGAKVQKSAIDDVLNALKGISFKDPIAKGQANYAGYDLEGDKAIHVTASKGGTAIADLWFGKSASRGQLVRTSIDDQVWSIGGASSFTFDKGPKEVRDRKVWDLIRDKVSGIELHDAKGTFAFAKPTAAPAPTGDAGTGDASAPATPPSWVGTVDGKAIEGFDATKVDELLNAYALGGVLNADDFGDGKPDADTGLAGADVTTITFKLTDGGAQRIVLGHAAGSRRYARKEGDPTIFELSEGPSGWAEAGPDKFIAVKGADAGVGTAPSAMPMGSGMPRPHPMMPGMPGGMPKMPPPK
ncbi:MAG: DUF4340 domain-containing protein [Polyangiales bacterium]